MRIQGLRDTRENQRVGANSRARALFVMAALTLFVRPAFSQATAPAAAPAREVAMVPTSHASVHMAAGSGSEVLMMVPKGTVMPVLGRKGEWVQVRLAPELRKTSIVIRWYKNEDNGWMHDSTVVVGPVKP